MRLKAQSFMPTAGWPGVRMGTARPLTSRSRCQSAAFTLVEVVIATAIVVLVFGGVINAYIQAGKRIEWTGYSLAGQSLANALVEQAKAGLWDPAQTPFPENDLTNLNLSGTSYNSTTRTYTGFSTGILDIPYSGTNVVMATNYGTVQMITVGGNTNVLAQFVRVDTVWPFGLYKTRRFYTNTVCTMVAPDN